MPSCSLARAEALDARCPSGFKVEKWESDLENIKNEVLGLHDDRDVYRTVGKIVKENGDLPPFCSQSGR